MAVETFTTHVNVDEWVGSSIDVDFSVVNRFRQPNVHVRVCVSGRRFNDSEVQKRVLNWLLAHRIEVMNTMSYKPDPSIPEGHMTINLSETRNNGPSEPTDDE